VTSPHAAVAKPEYSVEMQAGLAVVSFRDVTEQTQYLALLIDGDRTDAAVIALSFAKSVTAAKASSP
jgi:hypothetical protein